MATLILTAVGSAIGGPIGGALGSILGQKIDQTLFAPKGRDGPRLKELEVQTSSYGNSVPAVFGAMRVAGTVIWASDLIERRRKSSGGKGRPATAEFSYSANIAVALSSRPIARIGRIWAEGNLLRGSAGDLKVETLLRIHNGHEDQPADPLIASAETSGQCPAYRGLAYAVFEGLQLAEYGNRIPSLTFEIFERESPVPVNVIAEFASDSVVKGYSGETVTGYALAGSDARTALSPLLDVFPIMLRCYAGQLELRDYWWSSAAPLADHVVITDGSTSHGRPKMLLNPAQTVPASLAIRHYEPERDFQSGLQSSKREGAGRAVKHIDLPAALDSASAKRIAELQMLEAHRSRDGWVVAVPTGIEPRYVGDWISDPSGKQWRITEVEHFRGSTRITARSSLKADPNAVAAADPGRSVGAPDIRAGQTRIAVIDLPVMNTVDPGKAVVGVFANGTGEGWRNAALSVQDGNQLVDIGGTAAPASIGQSLVALPPHSPHLLDTANSLDVQMSNEKPDLDASPENARICWVAGEFVRFRSVLPLGNGRYRLSGLQRGCYGTEAAIGGHQIGEQCVILEAESVRLLDVPLMRGAAVTVEALGIGDAEPATAGITIVARSIAPMPPVHGSATQLADGGVTLAWKRRSRIDYGWNDGVDQPLVEEFEQYLVSVGSADAPGFWTTLENTLVLSAQTVAELVGSSGPDLQFVVRQVGRHMQSAPAFIDFSAAA